MTAETATSIAALGIEPDTSHLSAVTSEVSFGVTGMTCASCVRRIEKALSKVAGVANATVNLATERATVNFDPAQADIASLAAAVQKAGYGVRDLPVSQPAAEAKPMAEAKPVADELSLPIEGMTCASCVMRVEKALGKVPGVHKASVNLATEQASVHFDPSPVSIEQLSTAIEKAAIRLVNSRRLRPLQRLPKWKRQMHMNRHVSANSTCSVASGW